MLYKKHIFICTNERKAGERVCCGEKAGMELVAAFKKAVKDRDLNLEVRAQRAGCFDICESGPNVVVYPEGIFYGKVQLSDVEEIMEQHIVNNIPVERLRLTFGKLPGLNEKDLTPYFNMPELIRQTAIQLQKDLEETGEGIIFPDEKEITYEILFSQTLPVIQKLAEGNYHKLAHLLYRIDVSEQRLEDATNSGNDVPKELTKLILWRELQKVVIRNYYAR